MRWKSVAVFSAAPDSSSSVAFCRSCRKQIHNGAATCPGCSAPQATTSGGIWDKRILPAFLLCFFLRVLGVHRFYVGKVGTGLLQLFTGGLGIWALVDFISS